MADETSKTGLWLDADGKVVKSRPKGSATQIVREGGRVTSSARVLLDSVDADPNAEPVPAAVALGNDITDDGGDPDKTVTSRKSSK